jgi:hypothetical protein
MNAPNCSTGTVATSCSFMPRDMHRTCTPPSTWARTQTSIRRNQSVRCGATLAAAELSQAIGRHRRTVLARLRGQPNVSIRPGFAHRRRFSAPFSDALRIVWPCPAALGNNPGAMILRYIYPSADRERTPTHAAKPLVMHVSDLSVADVQSQCQMMTTCTELSRPRHAQIRPSMIPATASSCGTWPIPS